MTGPTRVLRVITRLNVGGPSRHVLLLTKHLDGAFETRLVAGTPSPSEGELGDPDVPVVRAPLVRPISPVSDVRAVAALRRQLRDFEPHIVHTHMAKAGTATRLAAGANRRRPRLVHTFHGHVLEGYFSPSVTRAFLAVERRLARRTDVLVAVSEEVRDDLLELGIGSPEQYRVIRLGLELDQHRRVTGHGGHLRSLIGLDDDVPLVGIVGRLAPIKAVDLAISAMARLPGAHLAVVGDGDERPALEALARESGARARVHFVGWQHDMPAVLADVDVVLLTSRNEGTPVTLIEAAACGRAVVATDVGGVRSVVEDGRHGRLVPSGDVPAIAGALDDLLRDADRRADMGAAARADSARFDASRLVADIAGLYRELLS